MKVPFEFQLFLTTAFLLLCINDAGSMKGKCLKDQKSLLLGMKSGMVFISSASTKMVHWNATSDCCFWHGVTCSSEGRVVGLDLSGETISDGIGSSSSLFSLQYLESLSLAFNYFNSSLIPVQMYNLTNLRYLNLSQAGFGGQIPNGISRLTRLVTLDLSSLFTVGQPLKLENPNLRLLFENASTELREVYLDGVSISAQGSEWCEALSSSLPNLRVLSLKSCRVSGPIHPSLLKLRALSVIYLDGNNLSSAVPGFLAKFSNLTTLSLSYCNLWGELPKSILQVQTLQHLELSNNPGLSGSFPVFQHNRSLKTLSLSDTRFSGSLPDSIGHLHNLSRIELSNCSFVGAIPSTMAKLTSLAYVDFSYNNFTGPLPSFQMSKKLTYIDFSHNALTGPLSFSHFGGLSELKHVNLGSNLLSGKIPPYLFSLPSLQILYLNENLFHGQLNEFANASASRLDTLDLGSNSLYGSIPMSFFNLSKLNQLSLSFNFFSGKMQLSVFERLSDLRVLELSYNNLTIDNEAMFLSHQFIVLRLASCKLRKFPDLRNQSKMGILDLSDNEIGGGIPNWIWKVGNGNLNVLNLSCNFLEYLEEPYSIYGSLFVIDLHSNRLQGNLPIPPALFIYVDYSDNNFSSAIPHDIGNSLAPALFFSLSNNSLTGPIPDSICNSSFLQVLDLSQNFLSGKIPSCLMKLESIVVLNLGRNNLSGTIPGAFPDSCALKTLDLSRNILEGQMPGSLVNCKFLEVLNVGNNKIADKFPCFLRSSSTLRVLVLHSNRFYGELQCLAVNLSWPNLQIMDVSFNNFTGKLDSRYFLNWRAMTVEKDPSQPKENLIEFVSQVQYMHYQDTVRVTMKGLEVELVKILRIFTSIDFSSNKFDGDIPDSIGALNSLHLLNLSHNALTGKIPQEFGNLTQLESLDLSANQLSGEIPVQLTKLTFLSVLNLSVNEFSGKIPTGNQFQTFSEDSFRDNHELCGFPLNATCDNNSSSKGLPWPSSNGSQSDPKSKVRWEFVTSSLGFVVGLSGTLWLLLYNKIYSERFNRHLNSVLIRLFHQ